MLTQHKGDGKLTRTQTLISDSKKKRKHKAGKEDTKLTLKAVSDLEKAPRHEATLHYGIVLWL